MYTYTGQTRKPGRIRAAHSLLRIMVIHVRTILKLLECCDLFTIFGIVQKWGI